MSSPVDKPRAILFTYGRMKLFFSLLTPSLAVGLLSGCAGGLAGPYSVTAYKPHNPDAVLVKVSLARQNVYVMEGDRCLLAAATWSGTPQKHTPKGNFTVYQKIADKRSGSYG